MNYTPSCEVCGCQRAELLVLFVFGFLLYFFLLYFIMCFKQVSLALLGFVCMLLVCNVPSPDVLKDTSAAENMVHVRTVIRVTNVSVTTVGPEHNRPNSSTYSGT